MNDHDYIPCGVMDSDDSYSQFRCPHDARTCTRHPWRNGEGETVDRLSVCQCVYPDKCFCPPAWKDRRKREEYEAKLDGCTCDADPRDPEMPGGLTQAIAWLQVHGGEIHFRNDDVLVKAFFGGTMRQVARPTVLAATSRLYYLEVDHYNKRSSS